MRRISFPGVVLGLVMGLAAGLLFGTWLLWLGLGLTIGIFIGSAGRGRRKPLPVIADAGSKTILR